MSILYVEGFDDGVMRGSAIAGTIALLTSTPRTGTRCIRCTTPSVVGTSAPYQVAGLGNVASGIVYGAFRVPGLTFNRIVLTLNDNGTNHLQMRVRSDATLEVLRNGTSLAIGTFPVMVDTWVQYAFKWTIDDASGVAQVRINGSTTPDINFSGDTRNGANAYVNQWRFECTGATGSQYTDHDDIVIQDLTGSAPENDWLGDLQCDYLFPNAAGDESNFTIAGSAPAATRHESLDEAVADDATTYVESNVVTDKLLMGYGDLTGTGTVYAVVPLVRAAKASAGARSIAAREKLGATARNGSDVVLSTSWLTHQAAVWHRDPDGNVWTTSNVNAAQGGFEVTV